MDNQTNVFDSGWIDARMAVLAAPDHWHPDGRRALAQFMQRRDQPIAAASPRWIQLSMAAAVLVAIGLVVTLLPWHALWEGRKVEKNLPTEPPKAATPPVPVPALLPSEAVTKPAPAPPPPVTPGSPQPLVVAVVTEIQQPAPPSPEPEPKSPVRVGPGVTPPQAIPPMAEPVYTDQARAARVQGAVVLAVIVRADGTGKVESVYRGLGYGLDEKAVEAFEKWRFTPGIKDGKFVDVQVQVVINFKLN